MRKLLIIAVSASAAALAAPAHAHPGHGYDQDYGQGYGHGGQQQVRNIARQIRDYEANIENSIRLGRMSPREGDRLLRQLDRIRSIFDDYRRGGLSPREQIELRDRLNAFRGRMISAQQSGRNWRGGDRDNDSRYRYGRDRRWGDDDDDDDDDDD